MIARALLLLFLLLAPACSSLNNPFRRLEIPGSPAEADQRVARAEAALAAGDSERAISDLRKARETRGLSTEQKNHIDLLLERCAEARIEQLSSPGTDPERMEELFDLNLPRQIAITAGVRAARLMLDQGEPEDAYQMIQKVDKRYPPAGTHHERLLAADVLFEAGMSLSNSGFSFLGFFSDKDDAKAVLEYLVQNYPQERRCDQAYRRLAELYEEDRLWQTAIERHQDLVTYHLDSPLALESEWRIPHLRLVALRRSDFDRREMLRAHGELQAWLDAHPGGELVPRVEADLSDCRRRLAESDLQVARFYTRIAPQLPGGRDADGNWAGARIHAQRALEYAELSGLAPTIEQARRALARIPPSAESTMPPLAPETSAPETKVNASP